MNGNAGHQSPFPLLSPMAPVADLDAVKADDDDGLSLPTRASLQRLLDMKDNQIKMMGVLGTRIVDQHVQLEEAINRLKEAELRGLDSEEMSKDIAGLGKMIAAWEQENEATFRAGSKIQTNGAPVSGTGSPVFETQELPESVSAPSTITAAQTSRRAKNAAHRVDDETFALEIGHSLVTEIRRLQSLLGERDKHIQDLTEESSDASNRAAQLRTQIRQHESNEDKYREENWELEVQLQELRAKEAEAEDARKRAENEARRLAAALSNVRVDAEARKDEMERLGRELEEEKTKHERDTARLRQDIVKVKHDKSALQETVDKVRVEHEEERRRWAVRRGSPLAKRVSEGDEEGADGDADVFGAAPRPRRSLGGAAAPAYPAESEEEEEEEEEQSLLGTPQTPRPQSVDVDALLQSLSKANRTIDRLKRQQGRKSSTEPEDVAAGQWVDEEEEEDLPAVVARSAAGRGRRGGRGHRGGPVRGRGGRGRVIVHPSPNGSEEQDDDDKFTEREPEQTPSPGLDPLYLSASPSPSPLARPLPLHGSSPLRPSMRGRGRGGAFVPAPRPDSLVLPVTGGNLGDELGEMWDAEPEVEKVDAEMQTDEVLVVQRELREMEMQTDALPTPPPPPVRVEAGMATEPIFVPPPPVKAEASMATDPIPVARRQDAGIATEPEAVPEPIVKAEMEVQTDPPPLPRVLESLQTFQTPQTPRLAPPLAVPIVLATADAAGFLGPPAAEEYRPPTALSTTTEEYESAREMAATPVPASAHPAGPVPPRPVPETRPSTALSSTTDGEYEDAVSVAATTPTQSVMDLDFYSLRGAATSQENHVRVASPVDEGEGEATEYARSEPSDGDAESVKASLVTARARPRDSAFGRRGPINALYVPQGFELPEPEKPRDMREVEIQTDEWVPPAPPPPAPAEPSAGKGLFLVGPKSQLTFVPSQTLPSTSTSATSTASLLPRPENPTASARPVSTATIMGKSISRRTPSIDSMLAEKVDGPPYRLSTTSSAASTDRTRPPIMSLPPPPAMPPPPVIPARGMNGPPPPRPTSPPPAELLQRAASPGFNTSATLTVPGRHAGRSMPASLAMRHPPSTSSFRSATNAALYAGGHAGHTLEPVAGSPSHAPPGSQISLASKESGVSRRQSVSSVGSERVRFAMPPRTPHEPEQRPSTDPAVIHSITQTMIGEFLYKYNRKVVGKGYADKRHRRFFWVHPYTKTLYWSNADPGASSTTEQAAKSVYIESVRTESDHNPVPPGLYQDSIIVATPNREMKFTAPTKERHDIWMNALKYLLSRPPNVPLLSPSQNFDSTATTPVSNRHRVTSTTGTTASGRRNTLTTPRSIRSTRAEQTPEGWNVTPRAQRMSTHSTLLASVGSSAKRAGTPAAEYLRWAESSPTKPGTTTNRPLAQSDEQFEELDTFDETFEPNDEGFEGLENVRACCDGEHDVGSLSSRNHDHHHHHHHARFLDQHPERPVSPSGWSFRSRSSNQSGGAAGLFSGGSIGRNGLFGTRRSKTVSSTKR